MTLAAYTGHEALTFPDYLDLGTGRTLTAEPGGTYDITPASGRLVPDIPQGWFTPVTPASTEVVAASAEVVAASAEVAAEAAEAAETGEDGADAEPDEDEHPAP